jgi:GNAT superfamily N-acetyltransferase
MAAAGDSGGLAVVPVAGRRLLDRFIALPTALYRGAPGFEAPLMLERREALSPAKNPFYAHAEVQLWVALRGGRPVGRISAQVDRLWLERYQDATGHFGFLDAVDDAAVFHALTRTAEAWLAARGMRRALGPLSLSTNEESGLLVDGFASRPMLLMPYHPPYAGPRLAAEGYAPAKDLIAYDYDVIDAPPFRAPKVVQRAMAGGGFTLRTLDPRRYQDDINAALAIYRDAWSENWGYVPPTQAETEHTVRSMKPLVRPDMVILAESGGEPVGMIVCVPNLAEAAAGLDGRLVPLGWARLLWRLKVRGLRTSRVLLFGVLQRLQGTALGSAIALALLQRLRDNGRRAGFTHAELSWILEDNVPMRRIIEGIGGVAYKRLRVYEKAIGP